MPEIVNEITTQSPSQPEKSPRVLAPRILAIDVLRGLTIAFMILVNDPGDWRHVYPQLDHAAWNGWTLTDLVFPNFLFLVGASTVFSLDARIRRGDSKKTLAAHIFLRALKIFVLKLILTVVPYFHFDHMRIYGVLTRIAICYLLGGLILLATRRMRVLAGITAAILAVYWALLRFVPIPGIGRPVRDVPFMDMENNLAAWLDRGVNAFTQRFLHTGSLYEHTRDPEGLLSTLPAVATVLLGALAALWIKRNYENPTKTRNVLLLAGVLSFAAGLAWNPWFPINKNLWTSSYVLMAAGWGLVSLGLFFWLFDVRHANDTRLGRFLTAPALIFGSNAIAAYTTSVLFVKAMSYIKVHDGAKTISTWSWTYNHLFARHGSTNITSVLFAIAFVIVCFVPNWALHRKKIFLRL